MRVLGALAVVGALAGAGPVLAAPVTFEFQGVVTQVVFPFELDGSVSVGTPFTGSYTYDPLAPNTSSDPAIAIYPASGFRVTVGNYEFRSFASNPDVIIFLTNDPDVFGINSYENEAMGFFPLVSPALVSELLLMQWMLTGGDSLSSMALPGSPPYLHTWLGNSLTISASKGLVGDGLFDIYGRVTSVVPEPDPGMLLFCGLLPLTVAAALAGRRARGASNSSSIWVLGACGALAGVPSLALAQTGGGGAGRMSSSTRRVWTHWASESRSTRRRSPSGR